MTLQILHICNSFLDVVHPPGLKVAHVVTAGMQPVTSLKRKEAEEEARVRVTASSVVIMLSIALKVGWAFPQSGINSQLTSFLKMYLPRTNNTIYTLLQPGD